MVTTVQKELLLENKKLKATLLFHKRKNQIEIKLETIRHQIG